MKKTLFIVFLFLFSFMAHRFFQKNFSAIKGISTQSSSPKTQTRESLPLKTRTANSFPKPLKETKENPWIRKQKLHKNLTRFHSPQTRVLIEEMAYQGDETSQHVLITYLLPSGKRNSFQAIVDFKGGRILKTWGRTIHENFREKQQGLSPDGFL